MDWASGVLLATFLCCALGVAASLEIRRRSPVRLVRAAVSARDLARLTASTSTGGEGGEVARGEVEVEVEVEMEMVEGGDGEGVDGTGGRSAGDTAGSCGSPAADGALEQKDGGAGAQVMKDGRAVKGRGRASGSKGVSNVGSKGNTARGSQKAAEARQSSQRLMDADAAQQEAWDERSLSGDESTCGSGTTRVASMD